MNLKTATFGILILVQLILIGCVSNSIDSDAAKLAELQCKLQKLVKKSSLGNMSVLEESQKFSLEAASLSKEIEVKYSNASDKEKLARAYLKAIGNCK